MDYTEDSDILAAGTPNLPVPEHAEAVALAFDFDGTLINSGLDKGVHILCAVWAAFSENGLREYLHPESLEIDIDRMAAAYLEYPGAPRFQQLSALTNSLINADTRSLDEREIALLPQNVSQCYPGLKESYNRIYSGLNNSAAASYWRPFEAVEAVLLRLSRKHDLYIASGVTTDLLLEDLERYSLDSSLFKGVYGGNRSGGSDKGDLLTAIRGLRYPALLFVGDSNRDLTYAREADAAFFRISKNEDFFRLEEALQTHTPNQPDYWEFSDEEKRFLFEKSLSVIGNFLIRGKTDAYDQMTAFIHAG